MGSRPQQERFSKSQRVLNYTRRFSNETVLQAELGIAIQLCVCNRTYQEWVIGFVDLR
jgi:hypothetical protein